MKAYFQPLLVIFAPLTGDFTHAAEVQSFAYEEPFGLRHSNEVLEFDLKPKVDAINCVLLDEKGNEVPWQLARNGKKLLLCTDLAANAKMNWRLVVGKSHKAAKGLVTIVEDAGKGWVEIRNGITGVR